MILIAILPTFLPRSGEKRIKKRPPTNVRGRECSRGTTSVYRTPRGMRPCRVPTNSITVTGEPGPAYWAKCRWADSSQNVFSLLIHAPLTGRLLSVWPGQTYLFLVIAFINCTITVKSAKVKAPFPFRDSREKAPVEQSHFLSVITIPRAAKRLVVYGIIGGFT
ncbi:hypothetical protein SDC9_129143 [bioreactor metagenome]|uniref:Uncharacterized protein n=1 Tax=bioreactor metagenome TaxID=1076179 RepID=A0A645CYY5_9ZZZZ